MWNTGNNSYTGYPSGSFSGMMQGGIMGTSDDLLPQPSPDYQFQQPQAPMSGGFGGLGMDMSPNYMNGGNVGNELGGRDNPRFGRPRPAMPVFPRFGTRPQQPGGMVSGVAPNFSGFGPPPQPDYEPATKQGMSGGPILARFGG